MGRHFELARFRAALWEYLGHPDDETPERRRVLYAIVILRLGLGLMFLLRGWSAVFVTPPDALALRLGNPARWGLTGTTADTVLFLLGCTELGTGVLLIVGAFTRVSAVTGAILAVVSFAFGQFPATIVCLEGCPEPPLQDFFRSDLDRSALIAVFGGLLVPILCGSPFLSADRALDKLEEEERDRAPATLPRAATSTPLFLRLGLGGAMLWFGAFLWFWGPPGFAAIPGGVALALLLGIGTRFQAVIPLALLVWLIAGGWLVPLADTDWLLLALPVVACALLITGAGDISLDHRLRIGIGSPTRRACVPDDRG